MGNTVESIVSLFALIVSVAIVAVLVSRKSATSSVISSAGNAFSQALGVAVSPVTGAPVSSGINGLNVPALAGISFGYPTSF